MATGISKLPWENLPSLGAAGNLSNPYAFTPYKPPPIPSGYYDPSLDAQRDAATRGLTDTEQDIGLAGRRAGEDYGLDPNDPTYGYSQVGQILQTSDRNLQDLHTAANNENADYGRNVAMLTRSYQQLGRQQGEQARKYGVTSGGIALLSAAKRQENQGLEQADLDTQHTRTIGNLFTQEERNNQDRLNSLGQAETGYNRGVADRGSSLSRAGSEDLFYGLDVNAQKNYQATQAGYQAPTGPANEFTSASGQPYRVVVKNGQAISYDQNGREISRRKAS